MKYAHRAAILYRLLTLKPDFAFHAHPENVGAVEGFRAMDITNASNAKEQNGGKKMLTDLSYISVEVCLYRRHEGRSKMKTERFVFHVPSRFLDVIDKVPYFAHGIKHVKQRRGAISGKSRKVSRET